MSSAVFDRPGQHRLGNHAVGAEGARSACSSAGTYTADRCGMSARCKLIDLVRWWSASAAVALALVGCGGGAGGEAGGEAGGAAASATGAPPQLDQVAALTLAQQSVNARTAMRLGRLALAAVSAGTATEDFEDGMAKWSNWDNAQVVAGAGTYGSQAMQVGTGAGGAGLTVPGIVEGTAYRLTAQVKVSDPSDPVFIGVNLLSSSGNQVIGHSSPAVSSIGYVTVTVDLVAPANSANAVVWIWKNAGSGYAYLDDVSFGPPTSPPPPPPAPPASNLVSNGGFESGMTGWDNWGNASVVANQANSGASALSVGTAAGGAGRTVGGITPGTIYRLVAAAKVGDPSETVFVGVNLLNQAGTAVAQKAYPVSSTTYGTVTFDITAPSDAVTAVVYAWKNAGSGLGYMDDVVFGVPPDSAPPPPPPPPSGNLVVNGGFENGLASWVNWGNTVASTGQAAAGSYAAQVGTGDGGFGQSIGNVAVGTTYSASAQVKVSSPDELGYFGLKFMDAAGNVLGMRYVTFSSTTYSPVQVQLAAPANATSALVYVWKNAGSGFASVDEVSLAAPAPAVANTSEQQVDDGSAFIGNTSIAAIPHGFAVYWTTGNSECVRRYAADGTPTSAPSCTAQRTPHSLPPVLVGLANGDVVALLENASRIEHADGTWSGPFAIASQPASPVYAQSGTALPDGTWYALWITYEPDPVYGYNWQLKLRHFASDGTPLGVEQDVAVVQGGWGLKSPSIGVLADGSIVAAWDDGEMKARRYTSSGTPITAAFTVGTGGHYSYQPSSVVGLSGGGFVVVYAGEVTPIAQVFAADGSKLGPPVNVDIPPDTSNQQCGSAPCQQRNLSPHAAALSDGGFVVTWHVTGQDAGGNIIQARRFNADGSAAGPTTQVSSHTGLVRPYASRPGVAGLPNANFAFAWKYETGGNPPTGVFFRVYEQGSLK